MKNLFKSIGLLFLLITIFTSCSKEDEVVPDYVGTWVATDNTSGIPGKAELTLTEQTFTLKIKVNFVVWVDLAVYKGSSAVSGNKMLWDGKEIGVVRGYDDAGNFDTTLDYYQDGSTEFDTQLASIGFDDPTENEYSVSGNQLTLKNDTNKDRVFSVDEIMVFTKK